SGAGPRLPCERLRPADIASRCVPQIPVSTTVSADPAPREGAWSPMFHGHHMRCFPRFTAANCRHVDCSKVRRNQPSNRGTAPMTSKKLLMFAVAGLVSPLAYDSVATAEVHNSVTTVVLPAPTKDLAPTTGTPARLKRNDRGQAGQEQEVFAMFGD